MKQPANQAHSYKEAQRLSGSCPMIWTWNGREFQFITDVLGVAPLGASSGDGNLLPDRSRRVRQIPGEALVARDGNYEVRITEELSEVAYLDQVKLIAVDHPDEARDLHQREIPRRRRSRRSASSAFGSDAHPIAAQTPGQRRAAAARRADRRYPDQFRRDYAGVAELHHWISISARRGAIKQRAVLVLNGWVDWADGSTFRGRSQENDGGLVMPYLQVKDAAGEWRTVVEDMGIPAGKPKTIVVDLTGKFLSTSREVRIVTNLCVYWDEIYLGRECGEPRGAPDDSLGAAPPISASAAFRTVQVHPRAQATGIVLLLRSPRRFRMWNPTRGLYTRYGDVE